MADKTPAGFRFLVKVPGTVTHARLADDLPGFRLAAAELARRDRLTGVLCQLPQSCHYNQANLDWLAGLGEALSGLRPAVEFRHHSWARPEISRWVAEHGFDLVAVDVPSLPGLYPAGWIQSGQRAYVRFHSRNAANWYAGDVERYDYFYSDAEMIEWIEAAARAVQKTDEGLFLFNNCHRSQAVVNAKRFGELFAIKLPDASVISPFTETIPVQRSLFE
jgi:uncharacterized protein YecE (DUF72 family)